LKPCSCVGTQGRSTGKGKQTTSRKGAEEDLIKAHVALAYSGIGHKLGDIGRSMGVNADSRHDGKWPWAKGMPIVLAASDPQLA
jgi:hypothetical protein